MPSKKKTVHIQYYALLREERGSAEETIITSAATPRQLYAQLRREHDFKLSPELLRVVINDEFVDWDAPLTPGDRLVFVPPVAGG